MMSKEFCVRIENSNTEILLEIGRSSYGWCFALNIIPERRISNLEDWKSLWRTPGVTIYDEYDSKYSPEEMENIIVNRSMNRDWDGSDWWKCGGSYLSEKHFHEINHSERGPNGLLRASLDHTFCVGHGSGTWDYFYHEP